MCNVCCHEFGGWCKAFTRTERLLTILEGILLAVFIGFLAFLVLHLIACPTHETSDINSSLAGQSYKPTSDSPVFTPEIASTQRQTLGPDVKCTWKPSKKTKATTRYYEYGQPPVSTTTKLREVLQMKKTTDFSQNFGVSPSLEEEDDSAGVEASDGEEPEEGLDRLVMALVKIKPLREVTFGCIVTVVSEYWTLTAASCIEAIEEVDSLDSFVLAEGPAGAAARAHAVGAVRVHPRYGGANRSYDVAALRSDDALAPGARGFVRLPSMLDYLLLTIGDRLAILGYGTFRSIDSSALGRRVRAVHVYKLPRRLCAAGAGEAWAPRHLSRAAALAHAPCAAGPLCAGALHGRGLPCNYCAGTPLLRGRLLLGLMADDQQCGVACEPALYVNLAELTDWLDRVLSDQIS